MDILQLIIGIAELGLLVLLLMLILRLAQNKNNSGKKEISELKKQVDILQQTSESRTRLILEQTSRNGESMVNQLSALGGELRSSVESQQNRSAGILEKIEANMRSLSSENRESLDKIRCANIESMERISRENRESLDKINSTVNEKLQKTLNDRISQSFETVNQRLAEVYAGLGEMKAVASGVSDLKSVLSNVKTRGIMGELQLSAILGEILAPEQYGEQVALVPGARERVDFAVKLPGSEPDSPVYLPIDSKFPGDTYANLNAAYESGDPVQLKQKRAALDAEMKRCAKSIAEKYIRPPYTTDFAVMFLPFEGLYAEVVNMGLVEVLQREYKVNIAGPSTMAAMLNSLQMGFRTLAIQQKSSEVWKILESAKAEFLSFEEVLNSARNRLRLADKDLEKLVGTRTNAINRSLREVAVLEMQQS
ncbi:MAG: DNA recombination protein RmuC [Ruminococcus sp.]|nr:DNA recombination protein RmuC [Ruminococcus sp.]